MPTSSIHNKAKGKKEKIVKGWAYLTRWNNGREWTFTINKHLVYELREYGNTVDKASLHIALKPCRNNRKGMRG